MAYYKNAGPIALYNTEGQIYFNPPVTTPSKVELVTDITAACSVSGQAGYMQFLSRAFTVDGAGNWQYEADIYVSWDTSGNLTDLYVVFQYLPTGESFVNMHVDLSTLIAGSYSGNAFSGGIVIKKFAVVFKGKNRILKIDKQIIGEGTDSSTRPAEVGSWELTANSGVTSGGSLSLTDLVLRA